VQARDAAEPGHPGQQHGAAATPPTGGGRSPFLRQKIFWVGVLAFASGFPLGVFYEILPVYFRQEGVDLRKIGVLALLGLPWTLKFLWAPAIDHYRHHRWWMAAADVGMGAVMLLFAMWAGFGPWVWVAIAVFTFLSATNDIAIDGYTIEYLERDEMGLANGIRIGLARVGMLASGLILVLSDWIGWRIAFGGVAAILAGCAVVCLLAPRERTMTRESLSTLSAELTGIVRDPKLLAGLVGLILMTLWLIDVALKWSRGEPRFWPVALGVALVIVAVGWIGRTKAGAAPAPKGPMFGAFVSMLERPNMWAVFALALTFKLGDASMGFMVKPFWVDAGFSASEIGLVSVNIGLGLSIAGGLVGGWYIDRRGVFRGLWVLGLWQAASNLCYAAAAAIIPYGAGAVPTLDHRMIVYFSSAAESFTGGLGTAAFVAFLMSIVDRRASAAEYAILSSLFALTRQVAGFASGFGAQEWGYAPYFFLTFLLSFPAYLLLPYARRTLAHMNAVAEREAAAADRGGGGRPSG
jgi:PAT family beta-lactamase induction signal transducer AmpG